MRIGRPKSLAVLVAAGLVAAGGTSASADEGSSICSVSADLVLGTSDSVIGARVQAFGCDREPIAFSGTVDIVQTTLSGSSQPTFGAATPPVRVSSPNGAAVVGLVDVSSLEAGSGMLDYDLVAVGESVHHRPSASQGSGVSLRLGSGPTFPGEPFSGGTRALGTTPYGYMRLQQDEWGCDTVRLTSSVCELSTRTTEDQTWQRGYKLTMTWPDPGTDEAGNRYSRCVLWPRLGLFWHYSSTNPVATLSYSIVLDVPAGWGSYTLPIGAGTSLPPTITPGRSTIVVDYSCYSTSGAERRLSAPMTVTDQLVPDLPPTQPTEVSADPAADAIDAGASGSVALGAAQLQGYDMSVVDSGGSVVRAARVPAAGPVRAASAPTATTQTSVVRTAAFRTATVATAAGRPVNHAFRGLRPGRYTVRVAAFNSIGSSETVSSRVVTVKAPARLSAPRHTAVTYRTSRLRVRWAAPSATGGGIARYRVVVRHGAHVVQKAAVRASARSFTSKRVTRSGRYRVTVTAVAKDGRSTSAGRSISIRR